METSDNERSFILQEDWLKNIRTTAGTEQWVVVFSNRNSDRESVILYCAFIPNDYVERSLQNPRWDLQLGYGRPGTIVYNRDGELSEKYFRYGNDDGIEPLVIWRNFYELKPDCREITEEFRLFFNLYFDSRENRYVRIDESSGDEEDVVRVEGDTIKIRLSTLKEYLSSRGMHLALYFSVQRYSQLTLDELGLGVIRDQIVENKTTYQLFVGPSEPPIVKKRQTYSSLYGKKLVGAPEKVRIQNDLDDEKPKEYENFIIGIDDEGNPVTFTCNPEVLADFFGKNPGNPNFVTPVFFKKEVLSKYYSQPGKYSVEDGQLNCGSLWTLRLDNNHPRYVIVFLGDLGQTLGEKEQQYWGSFNVPPDGAISEVSHKRGVMAEFADPTEKHLLFKQEFKEFQRRWESAFGWCFFLPLSNDDSHFFAALRIPLTGDQAEFDAQILALAKILVDSLNEEELSRNASREAQGSISILEAFFDARGVANWKSHIDFLRDLQALRSSGSAHRKGSRYKKVAAVWGIGQRDLREICTAIFGSAIQLIHFLNDALLCHE